MITVLVTAKDSQLARCIESISKNHPKVNFIFKSSSDLDITKKTHVQSVFNSIKDLDYCINCAAYTAVDKAEEDTINAYSVNVLGSKNLAEACYEYEVTLVHISTDFVFNGTVPVPQPYSEDSNTGPLSVYGETKLKGEKVIAETIKKHFIFRTSWMFSEFGNNFLKTMLKLATERNEINVVSDQIGSPTYARDLAKVILCFIEKEYKNYGIFHYCNRGSTTWYNFAKEIFSLSQKGVKLNKVKTKDYPTLAARPKYSVLDTSKIEQTLGVTPLKWEDSLAIAISRLNKMCNPK
ncbi:dTDP-4-dehydrorhamnose reductase [Flavobacteriales bacterium ALC-1]|nr:dTDP-4-dehydrorhamnose reductase [Flavobacteriales bacterium ALC-1]